MRTPLIPPDDESPAPDDAHGGGNHWEPPAPDTLEDMLSSYSEIELIGRGGMGAVYRARQISLDRLVAIKVLPPIAQNEEMNYAERFRNEARIMARLMHPGMIAVHDFGQMPNGQLYIAMEYVEGTDVSLLLAKHKKLEPVQALMIAAHVCDTLGYAHDHGIIHRDIKPANVMLDVDGRVKVADFGLAKLTSQEEDGNMTMGTPEYVAPECLIIDAAVDGRADLYSLGVMFYQMLTGKLPEGQFDLPTKCVSGLDKRWDDLVVKAMQHYPEDRYANAVELRHAMDHILTVPVAKPKPQGPRHMGGRPAHASKPAPVAKAGTPWGLLFFAIVVVCGGAFYFLSKDRPENKPAVAAVSAVPGPDATVAPEAPGTEPGTVPMPGAPENGVPTPESGTMEQAQSEVMLRLEDLDVKYNAAVQRDVANPHLTAVKDMDSKYLAALDRAITANPKDAEALRGEKSRVDAQTPLAAEDEATVPVPLKLLRNTYRAMLATLEANRDKGLQGLRGKYIQVLTGYQGELTAAGNAAGAQLVAAKINILQNPGSAEAKAVEASAPLETGKPPPLPPGVDPTKMPLAEFLPYTRWRWRGKNNVRMQFLKDGYVFAKEWASAGLKVFWEVSGPNQVTINLEGRRDDTQAKITLAPDRMSFNGTGFDGLPLAGVCSRILELDVTAELLEKKTDPWIGIFAFTAQEYHPAKTIIFGCPDPLFPESQANAKVTSDRGAVIHGGKFFLDESSTWDATGTLFKGSKFRLDWKGTLIALDSLFENCELDKGGTKWVDAYSSHWEFENCVFSNGFIKPWKIVDIGLKMHRCTFYNVDFAKIEYNRDAGKQARAAWLTIRNCHFIGCKIPESLLMATQDSLFEGCQFGPPETGIDITTPVTTRMFVKDRNQTLPVMGPMRTLEVADVYQALDPLGSDVKHKLTGTTLSFE